MVPSQPAAYNPYQLGYFYNYVYNQPNQQVPSVVAPVVPVVPHPILTEVTKMVLFRSGALL